MKIIKGRIDWKWGWSNASTLEVLVDTIPKWDTLRFEERDNLIFAESEGYVAFNAFVDSDREGYAGRIFKYHMKDGSVKEWKGPWSSRSGVMNKAGFQPCMEVSITDSSNDYDKRFTFYGSAATINCVMDAIRSDLIDVCLPFNQISKGSGKPNPATPVLIEVRDGGDVRYDLGVRLDGGGILYKFGNKCKIMNVFDKWYTKSIDKISE